mgnify:CR=1 FL=1
MSKVMSESDEVCRSGYTLTYFEGERGRAEAIRMMMSLAGQPYEEVGISISDWFSGYKQSKYKMEHEYAHDIYIYILCCSGLINQTHYRLCVKVNRTDATQSHYYMYLVCLDI